MSARALRPESYWRLVARQYRRSRLNRVAFWVIVSLAVLALAADLLASDKPVLCRFQGEVHVLPCVFRPPGLQAHDNRSLLDAMDEDDWAVLPMVRWGTNNHDFSSVLAPPSEAHWLGTDGSGRDVLARLIHGTRVSFTVSLLAVTVLLVIGLLLGLAGYYGGIVDASVTRVVETVHSIPTILLLVTLLAVILPQGWVAVAAMGMVIGLVRWTDVQRLVRAEILRVRTLDYVQASRALGANDARVLFRHVLPNSISPVLVTAVFSMAAAILFESALSFLGFGIPSDMASWGGLINGVRTNTSAWWLAVFPGAAIFITVTVYNIAGEGLRDAIDPKLKV